MGIIAFGKALHCDCDREADPCIALVALVICVKKKKHKLHNDGSMAALVKGVALLFGVDILTGLKIATLSRYGYKTS